MNRDDGTPMFPLYWSHDPQPIKEVDETRLPPHEFRIIQFLKKLPTLSTVKILAAQNDPKAMDPRKLALMDSVFLFKSRLI